MKKTQPCINQLLFEEEDDPQLFQEDLSSDIDENEFEFSDSSEPDSESDDCNTAYRLLPDGIADETQPVVLGTSFLHKLCCGSIMYYFLSLTVNMPLVYKGDLKDYWSTNPLIRIEIFSKVMSRDRYLVLLRMLDFANNAENPGDDRLFRIRYVFEDLVRKFKSYFQPFQNLVIDVSLLVFKGRLSFKQYIPSKRHRFGIKIFVMCDCESGMILDMIIYSGRDTDVEIDQHLGLSGSVVKKLMTDYLGKGHTMYTDNFYTSPSLAHFLSLYENNGIIH